MSPYENFHLKWQQMHHFSELLIGVIDNILSLRLATDSLIQTVTVTPDSIFIFQIFHGQ